MSCRAITSKQTQCKKRAIADKDGYCTLHYNKFFNRQDRQEHKQPERQLCTIITKKNSQCKRLESSPGCGKCQWHIAQEFSANGPNKRPICCAKNCKKKSIETSRNGNYCTDHSLQYKFDPPEDCCICTEPLGNQEPLNCGHYCHLKCLRKWCNNSSSNVKCPVCRTSLNSQEKNKIILDTQVGMNISYAFLSLLYKFGDNSIYDRNSLAKFALSIDNSPCILDFFGTIDDPQSISLVNRIDSLLESRDFKNMKEIYNDTQ